MKLGLVLYAIAAVLIAAAIASPAGLLAGIGVVLIIVGHERRVRARAQARRRRGGYIV